MAFINDAIALQIVRLLIQPFNQTKAYILGVIDENGNLRKDPKLFSKEESNSYDALHRIVFKLKKLLGKIPGGKTKIAAIASAYWLVKEERLCHYSEEWVEESFNQLIDDNITLVEEYVFVEKIMNEDPAGAGTTGGQGGTGTSGETEGSSIANVTGRKVSTDIPVIKNKDKKKYFKINRRSAPKISDNNPIPSVSNLGVSV